MPRAENIYPVVKDETEKPKKLIDIAELYYADRETVDIVYSF